jgi:hypothetical protein
MSFLSFAFSLLQLPQASYVDRFELTETLTPQVDRLSRDPVLLGHGDHGRHNLLFAETGLLHGSPAAPRSHHPEDSPSTKIASQATWPC